MSHKNADSPVALCVRKVEINFRFESDLFHQLQHALAIGQEDLVLRLDDLLTAFLKNDEDDFDDPERSLFVRLALLRIPAS